MKKISLLVSLFVICFSFNAFAMKGKNMDDYVSQTPQNEKKNDDRALDYRWTWLGDELCVQFKVVDTQKLSVIQRQSDMGMLPRWAEHGSDGSSWLKKRDAYTGKWSQNVSDIWSFTFDDGTIPVGVASIDKKLYAFNTYGEIMDGYNYWGDLKTGSDGLVATDNPEFLEWLSTQYLPECTSHE